MAAARPRQQPGGQQLPLSQREFRLVDRCGQQRRPVRARPPAIRRSRPVWQRSAGSSLIVVRPNPHSAACTGSTGSPDSVATARSVTIHSPPGSFSCRVRCTVCTALSRLRDLGLRAALRHRCSTPRRSAPALRQTTPENGTPRSCAWANSCSQRLRDRRSGRSGMQPGTSAASSSNPAISQVPLAILRRRHSVPAAVPRASRGCRAAGWRRRRGRAAAPRGARV